MADLHQLVLGNAADEQVGLERVLNCLTQQEQDGQIVGSAGVGATESDDGRIRDGCEASSAVKQRKRPEIICPAVSERHNMRRDGQDGSPPVSGRNL